MDNTRARLARLWNDWGPEAVAILGLGLYLIQAFRFAHTTIPSLDEGAYLYKGLLFAEGVYRPFQPYGVWTNKMPLAFLIPGYVQEIFGAGLRTGRYLAIFEGVLTLAALWLVSRRLSGRWLAVVAVWVIVLSPAVIKYYSVAASQSLTACLLAWCLALAVGESRALWQLILSSILAAITILTRQNMVILYPLLAGYLFWQHGWKKAALAMLAGVGVLLIGHWVYWPGILQIWAPWVPEPIAPQLSSYLPSDVSPGGWNPSVTDTNRLISVFQAIRIHFFALAGCIISLIIWRKREDWPSASNYKAAIFLFILFIVLLGLHAWPSLGENYCVYCFSPYITFFNVTGILLTVLAFAGWKDRVKTAIYPFILLLTLVIFTGIAFSLFEEIGNWTAALPVPRIRDGQLMGGFTTAGELLINKYDIEFKLAKKYTSAGVGFVLGLMFLMLVILSSRIRKQSFGRQFVCTFLGVGIILSPWMSGNHGVPDCKSDIIRSNAEVGSALANSIQPGMVSYWEGGLSVVPLLYALQVSIYAPQINNGYAYRNAPNSDDLLRLGLWNGDLDQQWRNEADYFIIEEWRYMDWKAIFSPDRFAELPRTQASTSCLEGTRLRVFKRIK